MQFILQRAADRGRKDLGWLQSNFSFSFSDYCHPGKNGFGLLRVFNDDYVLPGKGFGLHPHVNMEIISVMLAGEMNHKDSMGYSEVVSKGWVQIMSAGTGLRHEEYNVGNDTVNFLQIWIEPKLQNINPRYQRRYFPEGQNRNSLTTIVSNEEGTAHCWINQNARISIGTFDAGHVFEYHFKPQNKCVFLFVINGELRVAGQNLNTRDAIGVWDAGQFVVETIAESRIIIVETPINHL